MSTPTRVTIVRPKAEPAEIIGRIGAGIAFTFLTALLAWLIAPHIWDGYLLSYWQTFGAIWLLRLVAPASTAHLSWTKSSEAA